MIDGLVLVAGSIQPIVCCLLIAPYSAARHYVAFDDGRTSFIKKSSRQVHSTKHPLRRNRTCTGVGSSASHLQL